MNKQNMLSSVQFTLSRYRRVGAYEMKILEAIKNIDRKNFIQGQRLAYLDKPLPIGKAQTISQPSTVARMLQLLELKKSDDVLEIGAGSGWNAALISYLVGEKGSVLSLEFHKELIEFAKKNIKKIKIKNVKIEKKDFRSLREKFDKIIFTAGIRGDEEGVILDFAKTHLKDKGMLICPFRLGPLILIRMIGGKIKKNYTLEEYAFVPLVL